MAQLPEHDAGQMVMTDVFHFFTHGLRTVIAPEISAIPDAARNCLFVILAVHYSSKGLERPVTSIRRGGTCGALVQAMIHVLHASPAFAIKRHAQKDFLRRDAGLKKSPHGIVAVAYIQWRLGRVRRIVEQRAMQKSLRHTVPMQ